MGRCGGAAPHFVDRKVQLGEGESPHQGLLSRLSPQSPDPPDRELPWGLHWLRQLTHSDHILSVAV